MHPTQFRKKNDKSRREKYERRGGWIDRNYRTWWRTKIGEWELKPLRIVRGRTSLLFSAFWNVPRTEWYCQGEELWRTCSGGGSSYTVTVRDSHSGNLPWPLHGGLGWEEEGGGSGGGRENREAICWQSLTATLTCIPRHTHSCVSAIS